MCARVLVLPRVCVCTCVSVCILERAFVRMCVCTFACSAGHSPLHFQRIPGLTVLTFEP